jgi:hypothetical protein
MKQFLILIFVAITSVFHAQKDTLVFVNEVTWTGGQCCSRGVDCEVSISPKTYSKIKKIKLVLNQFEVILTPKDFHFDSINKRYITDKIGYTSRSRTPRDQENMVNTVNNIEESRLKIQYSEKEQAYLCLRGKKKMRLVAMKKTKQHIAYP